MFQFDKNGKELTSEEVISMLEEAGVDRVRLRVIVRWMETSHINTKCHIKTPYGEVWRVDASEEHT